FDTVDHQILLEILRDLTGLSVLPWHSSYLSESECVGDWVNGSSADLLCGVPQGSVLGPVLFLLYLTPLRKLIQEFNDVFADYIQLYCSFKPSETHEQDSLMNWLIRIMQWACKNSFLWKSISNCKTVIGARFNLSQKNLTISDEHISEPENSV
uniref:Reverse transcriptase domain-containing protein n=1 Tax=Oryzias latipes TaxID=8090 RepID=A0A3P9ISQ9_ORYLA